MTDSLDTTQLPEVSIPGAFAPCWVAAGSPPSKATAMVNPLLLTGSNQLATASNEALLASAINTCRSILVGGWCCANMGTVVPLTQNKVGCAPVVGQNMVSGSTNGMFNFSSGSSKVFFEGAPVVGSNSPARSEISGATVTNIRVTNNRTTVHS